MNYSVGDVLSLERNPIYSGSESNARYAVSERVISNVSEVPDGRTLIMFVGSNVWYWTHDDSEWIGNVNRRYRNLNYVSDTEAA